MNSYNVGKMASCNKVNNCLSHSSGKTSPGAKEVIDDLAFLDGKGEEVDLLEALDFTVLHEATQFGDGNPLLLLFLAATATSASATTTASTSAASGKKWHETRG